MKVIAIDQFQPGVTVEQVTPYLPQEVANVWRFCGAGIVRENYARADQPGVVIMFDASDVGAAKRYTDDFPPSKAGLLQWEFLGLQAPLPLEALFRGDVDLNEPLDRALGNPDERK